MKFYYVYRITNIINNKYYIGKHTCDTLENDYYGSGVWIKKAIKKYGKENFIKEVLFVFDTEEEALNKEKELVSLEEVHNNFCYNLTMGGKGSFYHINSNEEIVNKIHTKIREVFKNPEVKEKISNSVKKYNKENPEKVIEWNRKATETRNNKTQEEKQELSFKLSDSHKKFFESERGLIFKNERSIKYKNIYNSEEGAVLKNKISEAVKNSTFRDCYYNEFEKLKYDFLNLVINSNLIDKDIKKILNIPYKISTMLRYYEKKGYISNINEKLLNELSHPVLIKKTYCKTNNIRLQNNFILYKYVREDYINLFLKYQKYILMNYHDSYIYNNLKFKHFKNVILYIEYLGIISIVKEEKIVIEYSTDKSHHKYGVKTFIKINENFKQNYKLVDKESLNEHSITSSFDGETVSISWNKL